MNVKSEAEIISAITPVAESQNIEIVEVQIKVGRDPSITIFIDKEGGIDMDSCADFHRAIDSVLDELDPTYGAAYTLNVSSPGVDRPLKTQRDFDKCMGKKVEVKLYAPVKGKKFFEGILSFYDGNGLEITTSKGNIKFNMTQIAKINRAIEIL